MTLGVNKLTIVIPVMNEAFYLPKLIALLRAEDPDVDIVVADASSTDNSAELARQMGARVVVGGWPGVGRNIGARESSADILLFLDADVTIPPNFVHKSLELFVASGLSMANFRFAIPTDNFTAAVVYFGWNLLQPFMNLLGKYWASGAGIIISKKKFLECGGFDPRLRYGEDFDLANRVVQSGGKFGILPISLLPSTRRYNRRELLGMFRNYWSGGVYKQQSDLETVNIVKSKHV